MKDLLAKYTDNSALINEFYADIKKRYSSSGRYYHNLEHILKMLNTIKQYEGAELFTDNIYFAAWYHDVIYNPLRKDNEKLSADFAERQLKQLNVEKDNIDVIKHLIIRTQNHFFTENNENDELKLFLDADIETLGSKRDVYIKNTHNIRKEYKVIPDIIFNKGRRKILNKFLDTEYIYRTEYFRNKYEKQARENIAWELGGL